MNNLLPIYLKNDIIHLIHLNQKKSEPPKIHKYSLYFSIFTTYGRILRKLLMRKKGFRRNTLFIKFIRLYFYRVFVYVGDDLYQSNHILLFTPKNRYFLNFFLGSFKYSYFIRPIKLFFVTNKYFFRKYNKRIKKKILKQISKNFDFI